MFQTTQNWFTLSSPTVGILHCLLDSSPLVIWCHRTNGMQGKAKNINGNQDNSQKHKTTGAALGTQRLLNLIFILN